MIASPTNSTVAQGVRETVDTFGTEVDLSASQIEVARQAAVDEAESSALVGEYLGAHAEDDVAVTARFVRPDAAYRGWSWSVTLALLPGSEPTVSEVVLLPGADSLVAPAWLPWDQRIRPGDLGPGDLLQPVVDDIRVVPAYVQSDDPAVEEVARELGVGRVRVMSRFGREDAAARWQEGEFGPDSEMAKQAPLNCVLCAFYLPLAGSLGAVAGVCGNDISPADGRVVDPLYGCGAHSEIVVEVEPSNVGNVPIDETTMDVYPRGIQITAELQEDTVAAEAELVESELAASELVESELVQSEFADPEIAEPEFAEPEIADPELADPELAEPELAAAEFDKIDVVDPEIRDESTVDQQD